MEAILTGILEVCKNIFKLLNVWERRQHETKSSGFVIIDTRDRLNSTESPADCEVDISNSNKTSGADRLVINYISIPHKWPNINQYTRDIVFTETTVGYGNNGAYTVASPSIFSHVGHGFTSTNTVYLTASSGTSINGRRILTVIDVDSYSVPVNVTVAGTASVHPDVTAISIDATPAFTTGAAHQLTVGDIITVTTTDGTPALTAESYTVASTPTATTFTATGQALSVAATAGYIVTTAGVRTSNTTIGNYSASVLATRLTTDLTAAAKYSTITVTAPADSNNNKYTINTSNSDQVMILDMTLTTMRRILGFSPTYSDSGSSLVSDVGHLVNGITSIQFHLSTYTSGVSSEKRNTRNTIFHSMALNTSFDEIIPYEPFQKVYHSFPSFYTTVRLRLSCRFLTDRVTLPLTEDWEISFKEDAV